MNKLNLNKYLPYSLALLRIVAGYMFLLHGTAKFFEFPISMGGVVPLMSQMGVGGVLEIVGGILLILGLFTRPVAFLLSGMMAVAYLQFHALADIATIHLPLKNGGELALLYSVVFFNFVFSGPGAFALDNKKA